MKDIKIRELTEIIKADKDIITNLKEDIAALNNSIETAQSSAATVF